MKDASLLRIAVIILGIVLIGSVGGMIYLAAVDIPIPTELVGVSTGALGALVGTLVPRGTVGGE